MDRAGDLRGFVVGVTADRRGEEQAVLFRRLGADVVAGPAMQTVGVAGGGDSGALRRYLEAIVASPPDYLVANTGFGIRSLFALAGDWGLEDDLRGALGHSRILARGPKAAGALRRAGLEVWWRAPGEQLAEVRDRLLVEGVTGARVVFQRHGDDHQDLPAALGAAGALVTEIEVYRWRLPEDLSAALALVDACCAGRVDAVTFTAAPAVRNFLDVADTAGRAGALLEALGREVVVGCVGPVCAAAAAEEGVGVSVVPEHWRLGSLVKAVGAALAQRRRLLRVAGAEGATLVLVQGSLLRVGGAEVSLDEAERGVARLLTEVPGNPVRAVEIVARLWPHDPAATGALDVTVDRLRAKLGPAARGLVSPGPGTYQLVAEALALPEVPQLGDPPVVG